MSCTSVAAWLGESGEQLYRKPLRAASTNFNLPRRILQESAARSYRQVCWCQTPVCWGLRSTPCVTLLCGVIASTDRAKYVEQIVNVGKDKGDPTFVGNKDTTKAVEFEAIDICIVLPDLDSTVVPLICFDNPPCFFHFKLDLVVMLTPSRDWQQSHHDIGDFPRIFCLLLANQVLDRIIHGFFFKLEIFGRWILYAYEKLWCAVHSSELDCCCNKRPKLMSEILATHAFAQKWMHVCYLSSCSSLRARLFMHDIFMARIYYIIIIQYNCLNTLEFTLLSKNSVDELSASVGQNQHHLR